MKIKDAKLKYRWFIKYLITDFEKNKKYLSKKDIEELIKADKTISKMLNKVMKNYFKDLEKEIAEK